MTVEEIIDILQDYNGADEVGAMALVGNGGRYGDVLGIEVKEGRLLMVTNVPVGRVRKVKRKRGRPKKRGRKKGSKNKKKTLTEDGQICLDKESRSAEE